MRLLCSISPISVISLGTIPEVSIEKVACDMSPMECVEICPRRKEETDILVGELIGKSIESGLSAMCLRGEEVLAMSVLGGKRRHHSVYCSD